MLAQVRAQPRDAAELQRVRHLVQRDPAQQLVGGRVERLFAACARLGATNSSRAGLSGSSTGNSYWPSTRPARKPETAPASIASTPPASVPERAALAARSAPRWARAPPRATSGSRRSSPARSTGLGDRHGLGGDEPGVGGDEPLSLLRGLRELLERRRVAGGLQVRDTASHGPGELPVDHMFQDGRRYPGARLRPGRDLGARRRGPRRVRAAITGECGSRSSGAASGSS